MNNVSCPVLRHKHILPLEPDPERPDLVVAYCGGRVVYRASRQDLLADEAGELDSLTIAELRHLPEWRDVQAPKPTKKDEIVEAILQVRASRDVPAGSYNYFVPTYKE